MFRAFRGSISLPKFGRIKGIYRGMVGHGVRVYPTHQVYVRIFIFFEQGEIWGAKLSLWLHLLDLICKQ